MRTIAEGYELIVCSLDYDACIASHEGKDCAINMRQHMVDLLRQHPRANLILMVGSARQSMHCDMWHELHNQNGSCLVFLKKFLTDFKQEFSDFSDRISLDLLLLEDISNEKNPGYHFEKRCGLSEQELKNYSWYVQNRRVRGFGFDIHWQDLYKKTILYTQMHYIGVKHSAKRVLYSFYDDRLDILNTLSELYHSRVELIPGHITLRLNQYVHGEFQNGFSFEVNGIGVVDHHYHKNVVTMHTSPHWYSERALQMIDRLSSEKDIELARQLYRTIQDKRGLFESIFDRSVTLGFALMEKERLSREMREFLINSYFPIAVDKKNEAFISYVADNFSSEQLVDLFRDAIQSGDDFLAEIYMQKITILSSSVRVGLLSLLIDHKKYEFIKKLAPCDDFYQSLSQCLCDIRDCGITKSKLKLILQLFSENCGESFLFLRLRRFLHHLNSLRGDELNGEDKSAIAAIIYSQQIGDVPVFVGLLVNVISPFVFFDPLLSDRNALLQKYLCAKGEPTLLQGYVLDLIQKQFAQIKGEASMAACRALQFVVLSLPDDPNAYAPALSYWYHSISEVSGKSHEKILDDADLYLDSVSSSRKKGICCSFFCCKKNEKSTFSNREFIENLPGKVRIYFNSINQGNANTTGYREHSL